MFIRLPEDVTFTASRQVTCAQILYLEQDPICEVVDSADGGKEIHVQIQA